MFAIASFLHYLAQRKVCRVQDIQHEQSRFEDPAFPLLLHGDELNATRRSVYTNWHSGIELLYGLEGTAKVMLDSETVPFRAGQIVAIGSNVLHTIHADSDLCRYQCLIVSAEFLSASGFDVEGAGFSFPVEDSETVALFQHIVAEHEAQAPYHRPAILASVLALFVRLFRHYARHGTGIKRHLDREYPLAVMQALHYIRSNLCKNVSIDDISRYVGMSKYYFCRMFRAYTGTPVIYYINTLRCDYARKLIVENGCNVTEAAHRLGISNLPYFTRLYKRHMGVLPSAVRPARIHKP